MRATECRPHFFFFCGLIFFQPYCGDFIAYLGTFIGIFESFMKSFCTFAHR